MSIDDWILVATRELSQADIQSSRLDAELILAHTIRKPRTFLHAHGDEDLSERHLEIANARLQMRLDHTPIAYIIGHKDFYGYRFKTTPAALIPRPESEIIIKILGEIVVSNNISEAALVDVGTGTGCLGLTAKLEWPKLDVTLIDVSVHALNLAKENAEELGVEAHFINGSLLHDIVEPPDIIIANLPYVSVGWSVSPETHNEPEIALFAEEGGLALIFQLIKQAADLQKQGGHLLLESDIRQHPDVVAYAEKHHYKHRKSIGLITYFVHE